MHSEVSSDARQEEPQRQRLEPAERQHQILEGAIELFATAGFDVRTRDLAAHLGISQSLIFRYFPSKASLVDRVYDVVFLNRWDPRWEAALTDRAVPLRERLKKFYAEYRQRIDRYEVIRISLYSALKGETISKRYMERVGQRLVEPIVGEFRHLLGLPALTERPVGPLERDLVFGLHATVIYAIIRRHVFGLPVADADDLMSAIFIDGFVDTAAASFKRVHEAEAGGAPR